MGLGSLGSQKGGEGDRVGSARLSADSSHSKLSENAAWWSLGLALG